MHHQPNFQHPEIGTAWHGKHVIIVTCNSQTSHVVNFNKSISAPFESPHINCAETISRLISIGYNISKVVPLSHFEIQYILTME